MNDLSDPVAFSSLVQRAQSLRNLSKIDKCKRAEIEARRAIEDYCGLVVHDANVLLRENSLDIDLIVLAHNAPVYVQVRSSEKPASKDHVTVSVTPWMEGERYHNEPVVDKHKTWKAGLILILDRVTPDQTDYYILQPAELERLARGRAALHAAKPKSDGEPRSMAFRTELPRATLKPWKNAWHLLTGDMPPKAP